MLILSANKYALVISRSQVINCLLLPTFVSGYSPRDAQDQTVSLTNLQVYVVPA